MNHQCLRNMRSYAHLLLLAAWYHQCLSFDFDHFLSTQLPKTPWNETNQDKLKKDLFVNYDKRARPYNHGELTSVRLSLVVLHVESDELKSTVTLHSLIRAVWNDPKLNWNKDNYEGIDVIQVGNHELWHPAVFLYNSVLGDEPVFRFGNPNALVYENGRVEVVLRSKQTVLCEFDLHHWPFDTQLCFLKYSSWVYSGDMAKLSLLDGKTGVDVDSSFPFGEWNISHSTAEGVVSKHACCVEPFYSLNFNLTLVRNHRIHAATTVSPLVVNSLLVLIQFWLHPGTRSKLYINSILVIIFVAHLIYFVDKVGRFTKRLPLIVNFYFYNLYVVCFTLTLDIFGIYLTRSKRLRYLESFVEKHVVSYVPAVFFSKKGCHSPTNEKLVKYEKGKDVAINQDCYFAVFANRAMFVIYVTTLAIVVINI